MENVKAKLPLNKIACFELTSESDNKWAQPGPSRVCE